jgi:hypothetical protein
MPWRAGPVTNSCATARVLSTRSTISPNTLSSRSACLAASAAARAASLDSALRLAISGLISWSICVASWSTRRARRRPAKIAAT